MSNGGAPNERVRKVVQRHEAGETLDPVDVDCLACFAQRVLRAGGRAPSEAKSKIEERNQLIGATAEVLFSNRTPSAAGRCLEALARNWTPDQGVGVPTVAAAWLSRLKEIGLPASKQVENLVREHRKRNVLEITSE